VDGDAVALLLGGRVVAAAREDVDVVALRGEMLGQLADVTRESTLHDRRELPRHDENTGPHEGAKAIDTVGTMAYVPSARGDLTLLTGGRRAT
jgi:hypothetical protein